MRLRTVFLCLSATFLLAGLGFAKDKADAFTLKYEGGSAALKQDKAVKAVLAGNEIAFVQHGRRLSVPVESIRLITFATDTRRRFGSAALGVVPFVHLGEVSERYVGLTWTGANGGEAGQIVVKMS